jgi:hypothetical protein
MLIFFFTWSCGTSTDSWKYLAGLSPRNSHSSLSSTRWITSSFFLYFVSQLLIMNLMLAASDAYTTSTHLFSSSFLLSEEQVKYKKKRKKNTPLLHPLFFSGHASSHVLLFWFSIYFFFLVEKKGWLAVAQQRAGWTGRVMRGSHTYTPRTSGVTPPRTLIYTLHVWALFCVCVCD